jgi:hypothetical protein
VIDTAPCRDQYDRDVVEDLGLADLDDQVGTGPHAQHAEELMPS